MKNKELIEDIEKKVKFTSGNLSFFVNLGILKELMRLNDNIEKGLNAYVKIQSESDL